MEGGADKGHGKFIGMAVDVFTQAVVPVKGMPGLEGEFFSDTDFSHAFDVKCFDSVQTAQVAP